MGVMDYYRLNNIKADTEMRGAISQGVAPEQPQASQALTPPAPARRSRADVADSARSSGSPPGEQDRPAFDARSASITSPARREGHRGSDQRPRRLLARPSLLASLIGPKSSARRWRCGCACGSSGGRRAGLGA